MKDWDTTRFLDQISPPHKNWQGLSVGKTMVTWLAHILSEHNHYMSHVQDWVAQMPHLWAGCGNKRCARWT
jgi:hypothetical protein